MARYFDRTEFECKCCGNLPDDGMNPVLVEKLDELRERWGSPIFVSSGYRCDYHNMEVGGVSNSQHLYGNACDIYPAYGDYEDFYQMCLAMGFDGVGHYRYQQFVHVDCRNDGRTPNGFLWEG